MSDDDYGFVVAEPSDIDAHDWRGVGWYWSLAFYGVFDVTKWNKGVVCFFGELTENAGFGKRKIGGQDR